MPFLIPCPIAQDVVTFPTFDVQDVVRGLRRQSSEEYQLGQVGSSFFDHQ